MNMSNTNHLNILDFPDEILLIIIKQLNMVDVLYSLVDVNVRFNQIILDRFYIRNLNLTSMKMKSLYDRTYSANENILQRICSNVLPRINHQINELIVEQSSIERILHPYSYLQLYSLKLLDFSGEVLLNNLTSK